MGKTTLLLELAKEWGSHAIYIAADSPEASMPGWWEAQWDRAERNAATHTALLLLDEIHYVHNWSRLLKSKFDFIRRKHIRLHVVASGSSALHLARGMKETMAGRFEHLRLLHWPASELADAFHLPPEKAVQHVIRYGGYPGTVPLVRDPRRWQAYVHDSIVEPAISRDVLLMEAIRKPALLRQVFSIGAGHPSEIISLQKIVGQLSDAGAMETVAHYLHILEEACLVAAVPKYSSKLLRQRAAPPKLVPLNQAILTAVPNAGIPAPDRAPERWGRWVENACLAHAWNAGQTVYYWRAEPLEVDLVLIGDWGQWAMEIKTGAYAVSDLAGLFEFCRIHKGFRPLVLCDRGREAIARNAGLNSMAWADFLWSGPPE